MPLTEKNLQHLALAWQCFETEPKINIPKFRQVTNLGSDASARETLRLIKNKLKTEYGALNGEMTPTGGSPAPGAEAATPKKTKAAATGGGNDGGAPKTPGSRKRATPKKKGFTPVNGGAQGGNGEMGLSTDGEGDGDGSPKKKVKTATKIKEEVVGYESESDGEMFT